MGGGGMLFDMLGALVGFTALILLLSLVVTALVQASQSVLRLRGRNLFAGLRSLLETALLAENSQRKQDNLAAARAKLPPANFEPLPTAQKLAQRITGTKHLLPLLVEPQATLMVAVFGPQRSWILKDELLEILRSPNAKFPARAIKTVDKLFERWEAVSFKDYQYLIRMVTVGWGLVVAIIFQVNAPAVLKRLSNDADMRAQYGAVADSLLGRTEQSLANFARFENVAGTALERIELRFPELEEKLEEASGVALTKGDLLSEISVVLAGDPRRAEVLGAYSEEIDKLQAEENAAIEEELMLSIGDLSRLDVRPWGQGTLFYWNGGPVLKNWMGVLVTTILLAFGAPFWFERLKELARLRDALAPKKETVTP